jgi:hypothetical protein
MLVFGALPRIVSKTIANLYRSESLRIRFGLLVITVMAGLAAFVSPAMASAPGSTQAARSAAPSLGSISSAQVPVVNLTAAQKAALQADVTEQLKNYGGGQQIGINQVSYDNGRMVVTLPLPGETRARAINEPVVPLGTANCAFEDACLWSDTNFNGTKIERFACGTITLAAPFNTSTASIHNNQTTGTQTVIFNASRQILNASLAPSRINDTGVGSRSSARFWTVC